MWVRFQAMYKLKGVQAGLSEPGIGGANWNGYIYGGPKTRPGLSVQIALEQSGHVIYTRRADLAGMQVVNVGTSPGSLNWQRRFPQLPLLFGDIRELRPSIDRCSPGTTQVRQPSLTRFDPMSSHALL